MNGRRKRSGGALYKSQALEGHLDPNLDPSLDEDVEMSDEQIAAMAAAANKAAAGEDVEIAQQHFDEQYGSSSTAGTPHGFYEPREIHLDLGHGDPLVIEDLD